MSAIENIAVLHIHPRQRVRFNSGELREMWLKQYPEFFDGGQKERFGSLQAPDLLMYAPDYSDWFFCEVKGPTDRLRSEQREYFEAIAELCGKKIGVLRFRELKL